MTTNQTKPKPRKMRGVGTYEGDDFTFRPCEPGDPTQLNVRSCRGARRTRRKARRSHNAWRTSRALPMLPTHGHERMFAAANL